MNFLQQCKECEKNFSEGEIGGTIITLPSVPSTNTFLKERRDVEHGTVVIAAEQTRGRGKEQRTWESDEDSSLTFSVALRPERLPIDREALPLITIAAAVAVAEASEEFAARSIELKWPNDGYIGGKKFFGVLTETSWNAEVAGTVVLGIGVNVNTKVFPENVAATATSLFLEMGQEIDRPTFFKKFLQRLTYYFSSTENFKASLDEFRKRDALLGKNIAVTTGANVARGTAKSVSERGALLLETINGSREIFSGDITIIS